MNDLTARGLTAVSEHSDRNVVYQFGWARKTEIAAYAAGWWGTRYMRVP